MREESKETSMGSGGGKVIGPSGKKVRQHGGIVEAGPYLDFSSGETSRVEDIELSGDVM
jgi:hypothetical protein